MPQIPLGASAPSGGNQDVTEKCEYCGKDEHEFAEDWGDNVGKSGTLSRRIISDTKDHKWYIGGRSIAAHHVICSESMDNPDWAEICRNFGYDINHKKNGVMLPSRMKLACQLHVPLHRGNHSKGEGDSQAYPKSVKDKIEPVLDKAASGDFCSNIKGLIDELNGISVNILSKIDNFSWTITGDGNDYKNGGNGCAGVNSVSDKPNSSCPQNRKHDLKHNNKVLGVKSSPLKIGK